MRYLAKGEGKKHKTQYTKTWPAIIVSTATRILRMTP